MAERAVPRSEGLVDHLVPPLERGELRIALRLHPAHDLLRLVALLAQPLRLKEERGSLGIDLGSRAGQIGREVVEDGADDLPPYEHEHALETAGERGDPLEGVAHHRRAECVRHSKLDGGLEGLT